MESLREYSERYVLSTRWAVFSFLYFSILFANLDALVSVCVLMFRGWTERGHTWYCTSSQWMVGVRARWYTDGWHIQRKAGIGLNAIPLQCVLRWGAFCWRGLASRFFLQGRATANTHKLVLSDHFDLMMKHFYSDLMGVVSSRMTMHPSEGLQFGFGWITISVGGWFEISVLWPELW